MRIYGPEYHAILRNKNQVKSVPAEPRAKILMSVQRQSPLRLHTWNLDCHNWANGTFIGFAAFVKGTNVSQPFYIVKQKITTRLR